ncbi:MAG: hypothetical protein FWE06_08000 [Oscillospiraceae bacterium]|nr:hypothetical protein [Oscillospiraceae bacterium]
MTRTQGERIAALEMSVETAHKRLDDQARILENMREIAVAIKGMLGEMQYMRGDIDAIKIDVEMQKAKPGKRWEIMVEQLIALMCAGLIGGLLTRLFL